MERPRNSARVCDDRHEAACGADQTGPGSHEPAERPRLPVAGRTLYASVWHCAPCGETVRVFSSLQSAVSGEVPAGCPLCGAAMAPVVRKRAGVWNRPASPAPVREALSDRACAWSA